MSFFSVLYNFFHGHSIHRVAIIWKNRKSSYKHRSISEPCNSQCPVYVVSAAIFTTTSSPRLYKPRDTQAAAVMWGCGLKTIINAIRDHFKFCTIWTQFPLSSRQLIPKQCLIFSATTAREREGGEQKQRLNVQQSHYFPTPHRV